MTKQQRTTHDALGGGGPAPKSRRGRQHVTRSTNEQRVVECLRTVGPSSQAELARQTGLSRATVNSIVAALHRQGAADVRAANGRETVVSLTSSQGVVMVVEVGHDSVWGSAMSFRDGVRHDARPTRGSEPRLVVEVVKELSRRAGIAMDDVPCVAVAVEAPIDHTRDCIASWSTHRLPRWKDVALTRTLARALGGAEVLVENNANLAALAEWTWGAGRGAEDFLHIVTAQGVGGGLVLNGRIHRGGSGITGVLGHMVIDPEGDICYCGSRGCLTTLVSQRALVAAAAASRSAHGSTVEIVQSAAEGDPACRRVIADAGRHLGAAIADAVKIVGPSVVSIGGELADAGSMLLEGVHSALEVRNLRTLGPATRIMPAQLGVDAALLGGVAAALADVGQGLSEIPDWMRKPSDAGAS